MRIGRDPKNAPNLGFVSFGMTETNRLVIGYVMYVAKYMLEEFLESFRDLLSPDLIGDCARLVEAFERVRGELPSRSPI